MIEIGRQYSAGNLVAPGGCYTPRTRTPALVGYAWKRESMEPTIVYPAVLAGCRTPHSQNSLRLQGYLPTLNLLAPPVDMEVVEV